MSLPRPRAFTTNEVCRVLDRVTGYQVPRCAVKGWTALQRHEVACWGAAVNLRVRGHNDVVVPPLPACVLPYRTYKTGG